MSGEERERASEKCPYTGTKHGHGSRSHMHKESGFTLIEISVVVVLIGLFFSIAMPRLGNFLFQTDLKSVARSLKATVQIMRSKSIATHRHTVLNIDVDKGTYWGGYALQKQELVSPQDNLPLVSPRRLPEGIKFLDAANINSPKIRFGTVSSVFNPKGSVEETVLHLKDKDNNILTIVINAYTARFSLYDEYVDVEYGEDANKR